jgi:hypothetical protein
MNIDWLIFGCFNAIFNNISAISWRRRVLAVEEAGVPGDDIAEILLKMALKHPKINQSIFMHFNEAPFVKVKQYINAITKMELNI